MINPQISNQFYSLFDYIIRNQKSKALNQDKFTDFFSKAKFLKESNTLNEDHEYRISMVIQIFNMVVSPSSYKEILTGESTLEDCIKACDSTLTSSRVVRSSESSDFYRHVPGNQISSPSLSVGAEVAAPSQRTIPSESESQRELPIDKLASDPKTTFFSPEGESLDSTFKRSIAQHSPIGTTGYPIGMTKLVGEEKPKVFRRINLCISYLTEYSLIPRVEEIETLFRRVKDAYESREDIDSDSLHALQTLLSFCQIGSDVEKREVIHGKFIKLGNVIQAYTNFIDKDVFKKIDGAIEKFTSEGLIVGSSEIETLFSEVRHTYATIENPNNRTEIFLSSLTVLLTLAQNISDVNLIERIKAYIESFAVPLSEKWNAQLRDLFERIEGCGTFLRCLNIPSSKQDLDLVLKILASFWEYYYFNGFKGVSKESKRALLCQFDEARTTLEELYRAIRQDVPKKLLSIGS